MKIILLFLIIVLYSCSRDEERALIGTWKVKDYTLWERGIGFLNGATSLVFGQVLTLSSDSSYREQSCGNFYVGKWTLQNDSLILKCDTMWYRKNYDSENGIVSRSQTIFIIEKNKLVKIFKGERFSIQKDGSKDIQKGYSLTILK